MNSLKLRALEPAKTKRVYSMYLKHVMMLLIGLFSFIFIISDNFKNLGKLKSESVNLEKTTSQTFYMNNETLPVHFLTEFAKMDITNRMECLMYREPKPCMYYC